MQVALKLINSQDLRDAPKVNNGGHKLTVAVVLISPLVQLYSAANDPRPQMIPRPEMIADVDRK